jgi:hypothetical protein
LRLREGGIPIKQIESPPIFVRAGLDPVIWV